jgi:4-hydroxy-2-oxoheptanedioate aldolase
MTVQSLKQRMAKRGYILNGYCQMQDAFGAELYSRQGFDAVMLDIQHGLIGYESAVHMLQAMTASGVYPLARMPWADPITIMKMLDAGVLGITCAMINTAADAERLVRYCKYPPRGERSLGPVRAALIYGDDYVQRANELVNVFAMIETAEAVANVEDIIAVDGIDGVYIGPADLAMSMGHGVDIGKPAPEVDAAIEKVLKACTARGLITGMIAPDAERAAALVKRGFRFITLSSELRAMEAQTKAWVTGFRRLMEQKS